MQCHFLKKYSSAWRERGICCVEVLFQCHFSTTEEKHCGKSVHFLAASFWSFFTSCLMILFLCRENQSLWKCGWRERQQSIFEWQQIYFTFLSFFTWQSKSKPTLWTICGCSSCRNETCISHTYHPLGLHHFEAVEVGHFGSLQRRWWRRDCGVEQGWSCLFELIQYQRITDYTHGLKLRLQMNRSDHQGRI